MNLLGSSSDHSFDEPLGLLSDCHRRIEKFLDLLLRVAIEHAEGPLDVKTTEAVRTARRYFAEAAPKHTADEEESLFPRMRAAAEARGEPCAAIDRLESDHDQADGIHGRVDELLDSWMKEGTLAREPSAELRSLLTQLRAIYHEHIRAEDTEVFPLASRILSPADLAAVGSEMRARRGLRSSV